MLVRVLLIHDDERICDLLVDNLRASGFDVDAIGERDDGVRRAASGRYAAVVIGLVQTFSNGLETLRQIHAQSAIPTLMLVPREEEVDRIVALEIGADDCLSRPFGAREVIARLRALLRRTRAAQSDAPSSQHVSSIRVGDLELDPASRRVERAGQSIDLTTTEFDLLAALLRSAGRVLTREELSKTVFNRRLMPEDRTIDVHISHLRRKLGERPRSEGAPRIKTMRGSGYICTVASE